MPDVETLLRQWREEQKALEDNGPAERWRKPAIPAAVEVDSTEMAYDKTRESWVAGVNWTFGDDDIERFRQGRLCMICHEPQEEPFPEAGNHLPIPHFTAGGEPFSMAKHQAAMFEEQFGGDKWVGPSTTLSDEYERMLEKGERRRHQPGSSILLPGKDF